MERNMIFVIICLFFASCNHVKQDDICYKRLYNVDNLDTYLELYKEYYLPLPSEKMRPVNLKIMRNSPGNSIDKKNYIGFKLSPYGNKEKWFLIGAYLFNWDVTGSDDYEKEYLLKDKEEILTDTLFYSYDSRINCNRSINTDLAIAIQFKSIGWKKISESYYKRFKKFNNNSKITKDGDLLLSFDSSDIPRMAWVYWTGKVLIPDGLTKEILHYKDEIERKGNKSIVHKICNLKHDKRDRDFWDNEEIGVALTVMVLNKPKIWKEFKKIFSELSTSQKMRIISVMDNNIVGTNSIEARIEFLVNTLDDNSRVKKSKKNENTDILSKYPFNIYSIRKFATFKISSILGWPRYPMPEIEDLFEKDWKNWDKHIEYIKDQVKKK